MKLVFATHNSNKAGEIKPLLDPYFTVTVLNEAGVTEEIPETADTIEGNALLKARFVHNRLKSDCFADDTGLEVEALDGMPGVISARYAGEGKSAADNIAKLLQELKLHSNRSAKFRTCIAAIINDKEYMFEGAVNGFIATEPMGQQGFGYDPVFVPEGYDKSFAQMTLDEKNRISHRSIAVNKFVEFLKTKV